MKATERPLKLKKEIKPQIAWRDMPLYSKPKHPCIDPTLEIAIAKRITHEGLVVRLNLEQATATQLCYLAGISETNFSKMYNRKVNPKTSEPYYTRLKAKNTFNWFNETIYTGDYIQCYKD